MATLALVDDDENIVESLKMFFEAEGYKVRSYHDGQSALTALTETPPDLVVLDVKMPKMDGMEVLRRLRQTSDIPVIFLTSKDDEVDEIMGLRLGADDYITKPFAPRELIARIKALLRRAGGAEANDRMQVSELVLDSKSRRVFLADEPLDMGPTEFNLLQFFMAHPERAYTRNQLLDQVWGANVYVEERTVDVHIRRLRKALSAGASDYSGLIQTVRGTGYRFSARGAPTG